MKDYNQKYDLGIIGGMGTSATVELFRRLSERTYTTCDQDFMRVCILNDSIIPDRTKCILEGKNDPLDFINGDIKRLEALGVNYFIIPCNTAHYYSKGFNNTKIKFISMIDETLKFIQKEYKDNDICILATNGTIQSGVYFDNEKSHGLKFLKLDSKLQDKVMSVVTMTKEGKDMNMAFEILNSVIESVEKGNNKVLFVLACTELSLYLDRLNNHFVIDAMDILVESAITKCGYKLKEKEK